MDSEGFLKEVELRTDLPSKKSPQKAQSFGGGVTVDLSTQLSQAFSQVLPLNSTSQL